MRFKTTAVALADYEVAFLYKIGYVYIFIDILNDVYFFTLINLLIIKVRYYQMLYFNKYNLYLWG